MKKKKKKKKGAITEKKNNFVITINQSRGRLSSPLDYPELHR